jgi:hypothetical protein
MHLFILLKKIKLSWIWTVTNRETSKFEAAKEIRRGENQMFYMVHFFGVFQAISSQKDKRLNFS